MVRSRFDSQALTSSIRARPPTVTGWPTRTPALVLEVRFPGELPADQAEQRAAVIATRMSQSAALREVFDGVLAVTVVA